MGTNEWADDLIRIDRDGRGAGGVEEGLLGEGRRARSRIAPMAPVALRGDADPPRVGIPSAIARSRAIRPSLRGLSDELSPARARAVAPGAARPHAP